MPNNQKQVKFVRIFTMVIVTLLFFLGVALGFQFYSINTLNSEKTQLENKLNNLQQQIVDLSSENSYLESDSFVEDYAREVLGYGTAGQSRFR